MSTLIHQRVEAARAGTNPTVICPVPSGWVVLGDVQFFRGYTLLLADPVVPSLNALEGAQRSQFLHDMAIIGDALLDVTGAERINYEILGNTEPVLHAHLFPRYRTEPDEFRKQPVWAYSAAQRKSVPFDGDRDRALMMQLAIAIQRSSSVEEP
jgi:diadenosine tetraphosphate (Ap4A) HIT family hydrolase